MTATLTLAVLNAIVAALNVRAFIESRRASDLWAAVAWAGSTVYWLLRGSIS